MGWTKSKNSPREAKRKVRHFRFVKIICLRFLWARLSIGFGAKWLLFMTISWRLLLLNVLGNVTDSFLLCNAAGPPGMSTLCWKLYYTFHSLVLATLKNSFNRISHSILFYSILYFFFPPIKLNDFSDSRANKRHFWKFWRDFVDSKPKLISWEYEILLGILELNLIVTFS